MLKKPIDKLTIDQLEAFQRYHESNAECFELMRETKLAEQFRKLARVYQNELEVRKVNT